MGRHIGVQVFSEMNRPLFSCVIPVKGTRPYLEEAISSLYRQDMGDGLEIIIQDADVEPDAGQSDALNKGFAKARGEWLFWLNADDVLPPGSLEKVRGLINHVEQVEWIAGDTVYIDEHSRVKNVRTDAKWHPWFGRHLSVWTGGPSAFFRRELWKRLGGFDVNLKYVMDIDLWTRWARAGIKFECLGSYVWGFREHAGSITGCGANRSAQLQEWAQVDTMYGVSSTGCWRNLTRAASVLDGSWFKRKIDSARFRGKHWSEIAQ